MFINHRLFWSRLLLVVMLVYVLLAENSFLPRAALEHDFAHESFSLLLILTAVFGRIWASLYLGGKKNRILVQDGPYSLCRHPLYFFSALGGLGIAIQSHQLPVALAVLQFFLAVYPRTIRAEEKRLAREFGETYREYCRTTPAFFPKSGLYRSAQTITVYPRYVLRALIGMISWILTWYLLGSIEKLHMMGMISPIIF